MSDPLRLGIAGLGTVGAGVVKIVRQKSLLLEARTLVVLRLWKGYRDAQVGWCGGGGGGLALAIYAPRRGLLELWRVPLGARLHACAVGADCVLLEAPPPLRPPPTASAAEHGPCFLLQPSGALSVLTAGAPHPE